MIQTVSYKHIPNTNLEIGFVGEHASRIIAIRTKDTLEPIHLSTHPRAVLIGRPQREIRQAMKDGRINIDTLKKLGVTVSGGSFADLRKNLTEFLK